MTTPPTPHALKEMVVFKSYFFLSTKQTTWVVEEAVPSIRNST
jgi:hypothetical protein